MLSPCAGVFAATIAFASLSHANGNALQHGYAASFASSDSGKSHPLRLAANASSLQQSASTSLSGRDPQVMKVDPNGPSSSSDARDDDRTIMSVRPPASGTSVTGAGAGIMRVDPESPVSSSLGDRPIMTVDPHDPPHDRDPAIMSVDPRTSHTTAAGRERQIMTVDPHGASSSLNGRGPQIMKLPPQGSATTSSGSAAHPMPPQGPVAISSGLAGQIMRVNPNVPSTSLPSGDPQIMQVQPPSASLASAREAINDIRAEETPALKGSEP